MARPRREIDPEEFAKLCEIMCTVEEIAGFFDCSVDTIERFCHRTYKVGFAEIYKRLSSPGKNLMQQTTKVADAIMKGEVK